MLIMLSSLPPTVERAWGDEVASEFVNWLQHQFTNSQLAPEISAFVARQKVNVLLSERVSNLLLSAEPDLIQHTPLKWVWRVPVDMTLPQRGRIGRIGTLDVNAMTGEIHYDQPLLDLFDEKASQLYASGS